MDMEMEIDEHPHPSQKRVWEGDAAQVPKPKKARRDPGPGPCPDLDLPLVGLPREMRALIGTFLDGPGLAALASTCKAFEKQLVREQTGLLYYPPHWRAKADYWMRALGPVSFHVAVARPLRQFLFDKARLHVFDGLQGGHMHAKLEIELSEIQFKACVGKSCWFVYSQDGMAITLPQEREIADLKRVIREKHAAHLEKARLRRQVPQAVRDLQQRLRTERGDLLNQMERESHAVRRFGKSSLEYYIEHCELLASLGRKVLALEKQLEDSEANVFIHH